MPKVEIGLCGKKPCAIKVDGAGNNRSAIVAQGNRVEIPLVGLHDPIPTRRVEIGLVTLGQNVNPWCNLKGEIVWEHESSLPKDQQGKDDKNDHLIDKIRVGFSHPDVCSWYATRLYASDGVQHRLLVEVGHGDDRLKTNQAGDPNSSILIDSNLIVPGEYFMLEWVFWVDRDRVQSVPGVAVSWYGTCCLTGGRVQRIEGQLGTSSIAYLVRVMGLDVVATPTDHTAYQPGDWVFIYRPSDSCKNCHRLKRCTDGCQELKAAGPREAGVKSFTVTLAKRGRDEFKGKYEQGFIDFSGCETIFDRYTILFQTDSRFICSSLLKGDLSVGEIGQDFGPVGPGGKPLFRLGKGGWRGQWKVGDKIAFTTLPPSRVNNAEVYQIVPVKIAGRGVPAAYGKYAVEFHESELGPVLRECIETAQIIDVDPRPVGSPPQPGRPIPGTANLYIPNAAGGRDRVDGVPIHYRCQGEQTILVEGPKSFRADDQVVVARKGADRKIVGFPAQVKGCGGKRFVTVAFLVEKNHSVKASMARKYPGWRTNMIAPDFPRFAPGFDALPQEARNFPSWDHAFAYVYVRIFEDGTFAVIKKEQAAQDFEVDQTPWHVILWRRVLGFRGSSACSIREGVAFGHESIAPTWQRILKLEGTSIMLTKTRVGLAAYTAAEGVWVSSGEKKLAFECLHDPGGVVILPAAPPKYECQYRIAYPGCSGWTFCFGGLNSMPFVYEDEVWVEAPCDINHPEWRSIIIEEYHVSCTRCETPNIIYAVGNDDPVLVKRPTIPAAPHVINIPPSWTPKISIGADASPAEINVIDQESKVSLSVEQIWTVARTLNKIAAGKCTMTLTPVYRQGDNRLIAYDLAFGGGKIQTEPGLGQYWDNVGQVEVLAGMAIRFKVLREGDEKILQEAHIAAGPETSGGCFLTTGYESIPGWYEDHQGLKLYVQSDRDAAGMYSYPQGERISVVSINTTDEDGAWVNVAALKAAIAAEAGVALDEADIYRPTMLLPKGSA